jgi:hypothetical protein
VHSATLPGGTKKQQKQPPPRLPLALALASGFWLLASGQLLGVSPGVVLYLQAAGARPAARGVPPGVVPSIRELMPALTYIVL